MTYKEQQASNNNLDIPPPAQSVPHVSKPAAVMTLVSGIWAFFWFLGAGVIGKIVLLVMVIVLFKVRGPWLKGVFETLKRTSTDKWGGYSKPVALSPEAAELQQITNERMSKLPPELVVRGVWELIEVHPDFWQQRAFSRSYLSAVELGRVGDVLAVRHERKPTWREALREPVSDQAEVTMWLDLDNVASVELDSFTRFSGDVGQPCPYHVPRMYRGKLFDERHPSAPRNGAGGGWLDGNSIWLVFAFEKNGGRQTIFRTYDYDLAVRLRTRASNLLDQWRMEGTAQKAVPADSADDYL